MYDLFTPVFMTSITSVFDPLCLFSPVMLLGNLLLQSLWEKHLDWNDTLCDEDIQLWNVIRDDMTKLSNQRIPRRLTLEPSQFDTIKVD